MNPSKDVLLILSFRPMGKFGSSLSSNAKITHLRYRVSICDAFRVLEPYAVKVAQPVPPCGIRFLGGKGGVTRLTYPTPD